MIEQKYFEKYANYSVKVDRYFHCVNIYANNHNDLKAIHDMVNNIHEKIFEFRKSNINLDDDIERYLYISFFIMQKMHITNIYSEKDPCNLGDIVYDMQIFSYITCYCYQWNLFESFVSFMVDKLIISNKLNSEISNKLRCSMGKTKKLLDLLNDKVFKNSPFEYSLPTIDVKGNFKKIGYSELDMIRKRRNRFVHAILNNSFENEDIIKLQKLYDEDMWVLRLYAQNIFYQSNELDKNSQ